MVSAAFFTPLWLLSWRHRSFATRKNGGNVILITLLKKQTEKFRSVSDMFNYVKRDIICFANSDMLNVIKRDMK